MKKMHKFFVSTNQIENNEIKGEIYGEGVGDCACV